MIWIFKKIESVFPSVRPYVHKKFHKDVYISFPVITKKDTNRQTKTSNRNIFFLDTLLNEMNYMYIACPFPIENLGLSECRTML